MPDTNHKSARKTRWGCLAVPILATLFIAVCYIQGIYLENRPLEEKLRGIFKGSGFSVPSNVTDLTGVRGDSDFQGDFGAYLTFSVDDSEIESFFKLPSSHWSNPEDFKPLTVETKLGEAMFPAGTYMIKEEGPGEIIREYAVSREIRTIYYYRASW